MSIVVLDTDVASLLHRHRLERRLAGLPFTVDDIDPEELPVWIDTDVTDDDFVDVVSDEGCVAVGLPQSYPFDAGGDPILWTVFPPIGTAAWGAGDPGIACRSAAETAPLGGEELVWFQRDQRLEVVQRRAFAGWYGAIDWPEQAGGQ